MKNKYTFSFLQAQDMPVLHQTFLKAFSDYLIPIQLTTEQFHAKVKREGILPSFCVAAFEGNEMVAFILTGLGEWKGKPTAYNAGTGVMPDHRGNQLTKQLYAFLLPKLRESGIEQCLLEVIQENKPALNVYKSIGFKIIRSVDSFRSLKESLLLQVTPPGNVSVAQAHKLDWDLYKMLCGYDATWQNTTTAFNQYPDKKMVLEARTEEGQLAGFICFLVGNGAVLQMAVHPYFRNQGIATTLLREATASTESPALMFINVDISAVEFISYLERKHFKRFLGQYEMLMPL